jgi:O-antigen ligase
MILQPRPTKFFPGLAASSAALLAVTLCAAILTFWISGGWIGNSIECVIFVLAGVWAAKIAIAGEAPRLSLVLVPLGVPILIAALQLVMYTTVTRWETWSALIRWGSYLAVTFVSLQICASGRLLVRLRRWLLYFGFALAVVSTLQFFTSPGKVFWLFESGYEDLVVGPFVSRDRYAAFIELALPLALFEAFAAKHAVALYAAMAATMLASVIAGTSRAGSILVVGESAVVLFLLWKRQVLWGRRANRIAAAFVALAVVLTAVVGWSPLLERFREPDPYQARREMLASAVAMAKERPLTGFGLGSFETAYPAYAQFDIGVVVNHAHNDWAEWAAEGGVPMLTALLIVAVQALRVGIRQPWALGVACVAVHGLVDFPLQESALALWTFCLLGAALADRHEK